MLTFATVCSTLKATSMNVADICIIKRDGKRENFSASKISNAIGKAFQATGLENQERLIDEITQRVIAHFEHPTLGVEEIQDLVENELMKVQPEVAKKYIIYRQWRNTERERKTQMKHICKSEQCQYVEPYACGTNDDLCLGSDQGLYL